PRVPGAPATPDPSARPHAADAFLSPPPERAHESGGHGPEHHDDDERCPQQQREGGDGDRDEAGVDDEGGAGGEGLRDDECGEQAARHHGRGVGDAGVVEDLGGHEVAGELDHQACEGGHEHPQPQAHAGASCSSARTCGGSRYWNHATTAVPAAAASTGMPAGTSGIVIAATSAATTPIACAWRRASRGHRRARKAAAAAPSSPQRAGSPSTSPSRAPPRVARFQKLKTARPVAQKPARRAGRSSAGCASATAVDSSIVRCAAAGFHRPRGRSSDAICSPYRLLRTPRSAAVAVAAAPAPPAPITPMNANWLPPVNMSSDSTHVCQTSSPAATESAPKEIPYAPVANPTDTPCRTAERTPGAERLMIPGAA